MVVEVSAEVGVSWSDFTFRKGNFPQRSQVPNATPAYCLQQVVSMQCIYCVFRPVAILTFGRCYNQTPRVFYELHFSVGNISSMSYLGLELLDMKQQKLYLVCILMIV